MFVIRDIHLQKSYVFNQEHLLIYCRKFNYGYVIYEEIVKLESGQSLRLEQKGVSTHLFIRPDGNVAIQKTLIKLN